MGTQKGAGSATIGLFQETNTLEGELESLNTARNCVIISSYCHNFNTCYCRPASFFARACVHTGRCATRNPVSELLYPDCINALLIDFSGK